MINPFRVFLLAIPLALAALSVEGQTDNSGSAEPVPPSDVTATAENRAVLLQWSKVPNPFDYQVQYKPSRGPGWTTYTTIKANGVTIMGLTNNVSYDFRVNSINATGASENGSRVSATPQASTAAATDWNQTLSTGQSLSTGWNGGPPLTTTQPYSNLMLSADGKSVIPLVEPATGASGAVESMSSALANELTNLAMATGPNFLSIVSMHGVPGVPYSTLMKGTGPYALAMAQVANAFNLAKAAGKSFSVDGVTVVHGESDEANGVSADMYAGFLVKWQSDYQNDVDAITGQTRPVPLFTDQQSSWTMYKHATSTVAVGQWTAGRDNPGKIFLVTPLYIMDYSDGVHLQDYSYRRLGEYFGKVMKQVLIDNKPWVPVSPLSVTRSGKVITAKFYVPVTPLVIDTTAVDLQPNDGFEYYDSANSATITDVAIAGPDTVQITLSNVPTVANGELRYAFTGTAGSKSGAHVSTAPKGNIRDSDTTPALYQDSHVPAAMGTNLSNWMVTFDQPITVATPTQY